MKIYGIRIYPQSVQVIPGDGAPIFVHGSVSDDCSDFFYTFRNMAPLWKNHVFADEFSASCGHDGEKIDETPALREKFGPSLMAVDMPSQLMFLRGDDFQAWGPLMNFCEGALLPIFRQTPSFDLVKRIYWSRDFTLTSDTWPEQLRSVLHMWDDIFWQLFTTEQSDVDHLIRTHAGDPNLAMYFVDLDREYPDPSNQDLQPAVLAG